MWRSIIQFSMACDTSTMLWNGVISTPPLIRKRCRYASSSGPAAPAGGPVSAQPLCAPDKLASVKLGPLRPLAGARPPPTRYHHKLDIGNRGPSRT